MVERDDFNPFNAVMGEVTDSDGDNTVVNTGNSSISNPPIPKLSDRHRRARKRWNSKESLIPPKRPYTLKTRTPPSLVLTPRHP